MSDLLLLGEHAEGDARVPARMPKICSLTRSRPTMRSKRRAKTHTLERKRWAVRRIGADNSWRLE